MNTKLGPGKRKFSPKEFAELREYNWKRMDAIVRLRKPTMTDLWWARRFLKSVLHNPHKNDDRMATVILQELHLKWPEPERGHIKHKRKRVKPGTKKKVKKKVSSMKIEITKKLLRGTRKKLKEIEPKSLWWERKLHSMKVSDPKLPDTQHQVNVLRNEINRLKTNESNFKKRLEK